MLMYIGSTMPELMTSAQCHPSSLVNRCASSGSGPFVPSGEFTAQTGDNIGTGIQHKVLYSGVFELAMFIDQAQLYFICDIAKYCYSTDDTDCTVSESI